MDVGTQIEDVLRDGTPVGTTKGDYTALLQATVVTLRDALPLPEPRRPELLLEMIVARKATDNTASISLLNLRQVNPLNPRLIKEALTAGGAAGGALIAGAAHFFAFVVAVTVFATRPVPRAEAMTLHLAWKIARADRSFTLADMMAHSHELHDHYEVDKVAKADIVSYLNNLARAGSLRSTPRGYEVVERIAFAPF